MAELDAPRNLLEGWCDEGETFDVAVARMPATSWNERESEFKNADGFEARAARYLHVLTGYMPRFEDAGGKQAAVDLTLFGEQGLVGVVEVTSTLDSMHQRDSNNIEEFVVLINAAYTGAHRWTLGFEHGWSLPAKASRRALAAEVAAKLEGLDASSLGDGPVPVHMFVHAWSSADMERMPVSIGSWSANVPSAEQQPYLERLTAYLSTSDLVRRKLDKLQAEGQRLQTEQRHLYLLMSSTGDQGGLLPASPSFLTWGEFSCPEPLTDLWLDGGTGEIFHWNASGWVFHRV